MWSSSTVLLSSADVVASLVRCRPWISRMLVATPMGPSLLLRARGLDSLSLSGHCGRRLEWFGAGREGHVLEETQEREEIIERIAALDIGKASLVCCVRLPHPARPGRRLQEGDTYSTMTRSLMRMTDRLRDLGVTRVVMEATSDYWKPAFYLLEAAGFQTWLVNAHDVKHLPGRPKTDRLDAVWLGKGAERGGAGAGVCAAPGDPCAAGSVPLRGGPAGRAHRGEAAGWTSCSSGVGLGRGVLIARDL